MNSSFEKRVKEAHVEVGPVTATWWIGETGSWREAPGRGAPPYRTTSTWADFEGALREAAHLAVDAAFDAANDAPPRRASSRPVYDPGAPVDEVASRRAQLALARRGIR